VVERAGGNGKPVPPYTWAIDEVARDRLAGFDGRLAKLEGRSGEHETRLDAIESNQARRRGRLDDLAGLAKAFMWLFGVAVSVGGLILTWLNYASRH
jgi:hypothetical protein